MASRLVCASLLRAPRQLTAVRATPVRAFTSASVKYQAAEKDLNKISADPQFKSGNDDLHVYGQYLMSTLPKFIQQFSVYKNELTVYCAPTAITQVMTFLRDHTNVNSSLVWILPVLISLLVKTDLKLFTIC
ncbi:unnamed protein product [Mucor hiemalis]